MSQFWIANSSETKRNCLEHLEQVFKDNPYVEVSYKIGNTRTNLQNNALHAWCQLLADTLNESGITFEQFFKEGYELPWTKDVVKDHIWRPVQEFITGEKSTAKVKPGDYPKIYEPINMKLSNYGIHVPWPVRSK